MLVLLMGWSSIKLENMQVKCDAEIYAPDGKRIQRKQSFKYMGSMLCCSGRNGTELTCRLGAARAEFDRLCKIWAHASLPRAKKLQIYQACVVTKLMCCLEGLFLNGAELRKLDAFHHRCLRRIVSIPPSYISRISNSDVRDRLETKPFVKETVALHWKCCYEASRRPLPGLSIRARCYSFTPSHWPAL